MDDWSDSIIRIHVSEIGSEEELTWMVTPAVVLSNTCSYVPANLDTSVLVPPISNPITGVFV